VLRLTNPVRHYAWGSTHALPDLIGTRPDGRPHAEIWVGAHPDDPSTGTADGRSRPLDRVVAEDAHDLLGAAVRQRFGDRLPYLVKLLAADRPLSLQVHPDAERARRRHDDEVATRVPAEQRRYPDPWHKPEMLVALRPTVALAGLRDPGDAATRLAALGPGPAAVLHDVLAVLTAPGPAAPRLRAALGHVLALGTPEVALVQAALGEAVPPGVDPVRDGDPVRVARRLAQHFPGDPGVVASFLLHPVVLGAGEALCVPPGVLHCYVTGVGLEVMAASDDVLRAGLTPKVVDAAEVLAALDAEPAPPAVLRPDPRVAGALRVRAYRSAAREFALLLVDVDATEPACVPGAPVGGPRTLVCLDGVVQVATRAGRCGLGAGESVLVPDVEGPVRLSGRGTVAVVGVGGQEETA
jgi:mannose-6-phosphate isomerase